VRHDYLDWLMISNERHLRHVLVDFLEHYHHERPHRGLGLRPPDPAPQTSDGPVQRRDRLDGLLRDCYRAAA
jgi:putative transposase